MKNKPRVARDSTGDYIVTVIDDDIEYTSLCCLEEVVSSNGRIKVLRFQSDEFQHLIMLGRVQIKEVMEAIRMLGR